MTELVERLGPLAWPLLACSFLALTLIVERLLFFLRLARWPEARGRAVLQAHAHLPRAQREEVAALWLAEHRHSVFSGLKLLQLIAVASPLLGLLGTVLGMIVAFQRIAGHDGPVHPGLLADGIWQAMLTTAAGLIIALPALVAVHLFRSLGQRHVERLGLALSRHSLALEGLIEPDQPRGRWAAARMAEMPA